MSKISKINFTLKKSVQKGSTIPIQDKPILAYYIRLNLNAPIYKTKKTDLFAGLKKAVSSTVNAVSKGAKVIAKDAKAIANDVVKEVNKTAEQMERVAVDVIKETEIYQEINYQIQKQQLKELQLRKQKELRIQEEIRLQKQLQLKKELELKTAKEEFESLLNTYKSLAGLNAISITIPSFKELSAIFSAKRLLLAEIENEKMLQGLEKSFTKGASYFLPGYSSKIQSTYLSEVKPNDNNNYKDEIKRLANLYLKNSSELEPALIEFNAINKNYFSYAASCLKEIFDLKNETTNKFLERIPKIGLIPKSLRVQEQVRLCKTILKDYREISKIYFNDGIMKIFKEYNSQYETIKLYVDAHKNDKNFDKQYSEKILQKLKKSRDERVKTNIKMVNNFGKNGYNLVNSCEQVEKRGKKELAIKTAVSLISFL